MTEKIFNCKYTICDKMFIKTYEDYKQGFYTSGMGCRVQVVYRYYSCGGVYGFHIQGRIGRILLLQLAGGSCLKSRVGRAVVGTRRKAWNCILIFTSDERIRDKYEIDRRKSA